MTKKKKKTEELPEEMREKATDNEKTIETKESPETPEKKAELTPEQQIEEQSKKIVELNDKYLRLYAEFDNYRRRTLKERVELIQTASSELMLALLPVLDDFDRALDAFEKSNEMGALKEGVVLVSSKFRTILSQKGLEEMKACGEAFNPELHNAIANSPAPEEEQKGKVIDQVEKGYYLNGKILRHAKVVVGK